MLGISRLIDFDWVVYMCRLFHFYDVICETIVLDLFRILKSHLFNLVL